MGQLLPGGEPFLSVRGPVGCLLVHGFTGTPREMRPLGDFLAARGHSVLGVRLFGHASSLPHLSRARLEDWLASVEDGFALLRGVCPKVVLVGTSLGGALALASAAELEVAGVVSLSAPFELPDGRLRALRPLLPALAKVVPYVPKGPAYWHEPAAREGHLEYPKYPVRGFVELGRLVERVQRVLPRLAVPALVVHSENDDAVPVEHARRLHQELGSPDKEFLVVKNSGHMVGNDAERDAVRAAVAAFVERVGR